MNPTDLAAYYAFCDLSEYNGPVDFVKLKALYSFVYLRVCWGTNIDKRFLEYRAGAEAVGLPWGGYAFLDWRFSLPLQTAFFISLMKPDPGQAAPVLDLEMDPTNYATKYGGNRGVIIDVMPKTRRLIGSPRRPLKYRLMSLSQPLTMSRAVVEGNVWNWLTGVQKGLGLTPDIYSGYYYWLQWMTPDPGWAAYKFWLAWYAAQQYIKVPPPWKDWDKWQYAGNGNAIPIWPTPPGIGEGKSLDIDWAKTLPAPVVPPPPTPALLCPNCGHVMPAGWSYVKP
jgi:GH25 family lysozyme M1 (1,4-beta-N-acetylmuramidase)